MKQHNDSAHQRHSNCLCKGSFLFNHEFQNLLTWFLFPVDRDSFLEFTNLNENYINLIIFVSKRMGI